ncbi:MAG: right-handed parallel beta-helix repeat-containing protein [Anaerolineae bacterium]|nr:right-handed parallel beta-helix repeat-containing protein [Anaerolineae bacterium]
MRRSLLVLTVTVLLLGLCAGMASAATQEHAAWRLSEQACTPITLGDTGWSVPSVGTWDPATRSATLTTDLSCAIQITADNLTLDGGGHTVTGAGSGDGVVLNGRFGVTITNLTVRSFARGFYVAYSSEITLTANTATGNSYGIYLNTEATSVQLVGNTANNNNYGIFITYGSGNLLEGNTTDGNKYHGIHIERCGSHTLTGNTASSNDDGIYLMSSHFNTLTGNAAHDNRGYGIRLESCVANTLDGNLMERNRFGFRVEASTDSQYTHTIAATNLVDGKPIYYLVDAASPTVDGSSGAGAVYLIRCQDANVRDLVISKTDVGVLLWNTTNTSISNVQTSACNVGFRLRGSSGNILTRNTAGSHAMHGFWLQLSGSNTLTDNTATANATYGILLDGSSGNVLTGNLIADNSTGLYLTAASNNQVYNNRFVSNGVQARLYSGTGNVFNKPAPTGGNYWSDHTGPDADLDGFVDEPYRFESGGVDELPFAEQTGWTDTVPPVTTVSFAGTAGNNGWYLSDVQVTLTAEDNPGGSGVDSIAYSFDGVNWLPYTAPFTVEKEGVTTLYYRATDKAGNVEQPGTETVLFFDDLTSFDPAAWIDATFLPHYVGRPQTISPVTDGGRTAIYMQSDDTPAPTDKRRGIAWPVSIPTAPEMAVEVALKPLRSSSDIYTIDGLAELWLYNCASGRYARISAIAADYGDSPTVVAEISGQPVRTSPVPGFNLNEWQYFRIESTGGRTTISLLDGARNPRWSTTYDVALSSLFSDYNIALSQQLGQPYATTWHRKALYDYVKAVKVDRVAKSKVLKIDRTPPAIEAAPDREPNIHGWYNADVTISFTATDALSGLDTVSAPVTVSEEGEGLSVTGTAVDLAGNSASVTLSGINLDKTPPTLVGALDPEPNAHGWNNTDVTVHWLAEDALSGVDPATLPADEIITGEGTGFGAGPVTVSDLAGNSAMASVDNVNIDRTPPVVVLGEPSSAPNDAGWYNVDVAVPFTATDSLSGLDPDGPSSPLMITGEGAAVSATLTVTDLAGNATTVTSPSFRIDKTPPVAHATASTSGGAYTAGQWTNQDVTVTFVASDALSGVATPPEPVTVSTEGRDQVATATCTDLAGNVAQVSFGPINIDKTPPIIEAMASTPSGEYSSGTWTNEDVTVTFLYHDALSGIASWPEPTTVTAEGEGWAVVGTCTDMAGNSATATFGGINIDKTPPTIVATASTAAGKYTRGTWTNMDVTVAFACADALSGVAREPAPVTVSSEGPAQCVSGTCVDRAGNQASTVFWGIYIDKTPPVLIGHRSPAPNAEGWNNTDVTITFEAYDALSGLASRPAPTTVTIEGANLAVVGTAVDNAGNSISMTVGNINIDKTPPTLLIVRPQPDEGLFVGTALDFAAEDALSGVDTVTGVLDTGMTRREVQSGEVLPTGVYVLSVRATDIAGNSADDSRFFAVCDPKGPFVSGSGSFTSPVGAIVDKPTYTGTALFSFTCKYQNKETVPSSRWTLDFQVSDIGLRSDGYEWLAISGANIWFRGRGSVNGNPGYRFMVSAVDGRLAGTNQHLIRVIIWDGATGHLVYDSQPGASILAAPAGIVLKGGSIQVKG